MNNGEDIIEQVPIIRLFQKLSLFRDPYLFSQAINIHVVDAHLMELEEDLLMKKLDCEGTPKDGSFEVVSGVSQMWIFGLYELIRTWRQRIRMLEDLKNKIVALSAAEKQDEIERIMTHTRGDSPFTGVNVSMWENCLKSIVKGDFDMETLLADRENMLGVFRQLEEVRMQLAKHEMARKHGVFASQPGVGSIWHDGSIRWWDFRTEGDVNVECGVSRRDIANGMRYLYIEKYKNR